MNRNNIHSNLYKIVFTDANDNPVQIKPEYLPEVDGLPDQTGNAGKFLSTDGTESSWETIVIPPSEPSDWNETDPLSPAFILNKPTLGTAASQNVGAFATAAQGTLADTAVQPGDLADVASSGDYNELINLPDLGSAAGNETTDFATAAQGTTADTALQPADVAVVAISGSYSDLLDAPDLADVATTADYLDLINTPTNLSEFVDDLPAELPDQTGKDGYILGTDGANPVWRPRCNPILKIDSSRPVAYAGKADRIIKLEYTINSVTRYKYMTSDLDTDWPNRASFSYTICP